jgi:hypothetical protein
MSIPFPSREFFEALKQRIDEDPGIMEKVEPSEAYFGLSIGEGLYTMELDGRSCLGIANGGNTLDLDFVLAAPAETWQEILEAIQEHGGADPDHTLAALIASGAIEVRSERDDGAELAQPALGFLQAFLDQAQHLGDG